MEMIRALSAAIVAVVLAAGASSAQSTTFGPTVQVTPREAGAVIWQMFAYSHPHDGRHLMVCGMMEAPGRESKISYLYSSADGGLTWHRALGDDSGTWVSDVNCLYGAGGRAYFVDNVSNFNTNGGSHAVQYMHAYLSGDNGETWRRSHVRKDGWVDWPYLANI